MKFFFDFAQYDRKCLKKETLQSYNLTQQTFHEVGQVLRITFLPFFILIFLLKPKTASDSLWVGEIQAG